MSHITHDDLDKLAKLCALELSAEDKEKLLPQLESIIGLVGKLQECDTEISPEDEAELKTMMLNSWLQPTIDRADFLRNVSHPTDRDMIELNTSTNQ